MTSPNDLLEAFESLLRRSVEQFFPRAPVSLADEKNQPSGIELDLFGRKFVVGPPFALPFSSAEERLIRVIGAVVEKRVRQMNDSLTLDVVEAMHVPIEDFVVAEYVDMPNASRLTAALESLRSAALSTYENREISTGALLLAAELDPAEPSRPMPPRSPSYDIRLSAVKGFHRLADGLSSVFLVNLHGSIIRSAGLEAWVRRTNASALTGPVSKKYVNHARATTGGRHVCAVLMPSHEIKVFARGTLAFAFSVARWRLLDAQSKYDTWRDRVGKTGLPDLADRLFRAALELAEDRKGAIFLVLRDPDRDLSLLVSEGDRVGGAADKFGEARSNEGDGEGVVKRPLHILAHGRGVEDVDDDVLRSFAYVDGAVVVDCKGRILSFGAILRIPPEAPKALRAAEGARSAIAQATSHYGPVLKVSEDGLVAMFDRGEQLWEM